MSNKKFKREIKYLNSIVLIVLITIFAYGLTYIITKYKIDIMCILNFIDNNSQIGIIHFWDNTTISNFSLYLFAAQIALTVLTGTTVSFITTHLDKKYYGYKVKELLIYRFNKVQLNFLDFVISNFFLVLLSVTIMMIKYSEISMLFIFLITLVFTIRIYVEIFNVFFSHKFFEYRTQKIIINELNKIATNNSYSYVDSILNRIKDHSYDLISNRQFKEYRENIILVNKLSLDFNISSIQDIMNSILFGGFIEDIAKFLYSKGYYDELINLMNSEFVGKNCNPKNVKIDDIKVAEMFCSHYCQAKLMTSRLYFKSILQKISKDSETRFDNEVEYLIEHFMSSFNSIYISSLEYENQIYSNMNKGNWSNLLINIYTNIINYDNKFASIFIDKLTKLYISEENEWVVMNLNQIISLSNPSGMLELVEKIISKYSSRARAVDLKKRIITAKDVSK